MDDRTGRYTAAPESGVAPWQDTNTRTPPPKRPQDGSHGQSRSRRSERYRLRRTLWEVSKLRRCRGCGRAMRGEEVEVHRIDEPEGSRATIVGLMACGSIWTCPVCAAHIRYVRSVEIAEACVRQLDSGGGLLFLTLTLRHHKGDDLAQLLDGLLNALQATTRGQPWKRKVARYGIIGRIRSIEVTYGGTNGWHPHAHLLLFTEAPLTPAEVRELDAWLSARWTVMVARRGLAEPSQERGCVLELVQGGDAVGQYVAKVQESASVPMEIARGDLKSGRRGGLMPFEILDIAGSGETLALHLWWTYEQVTKGRRCIEWSRGLREHLAIGAELEDAEIVTEDTTSDETLLCVLPKRDWHAVTAAGLDARLLAAAEDNGVHGVVAVVADAVATMNRRQAS